MSRKARGLILGKLVGKRRKNEVDLGKLRDTMYVEGQTGPYTDGSMGVVLPFDFPLYVRAYRLEQDTDRHHPPKQISTALVGWTAELDAWTHGVKVYVRIGLLDGTLKVFVEDAEGNECVATYEREQ